MKETRKHWAIDEDMLLDGAEKRLQNGDYLGALTMLNKRARMYAPSADAAALYADVYEGMELYPLAADAWFRFLDTCNEADFAEGYEGLAVSFMNMGNELQSAYYYHRAYDGEEGDEAPIPFPEETEKPRRGGRRPRARKARRGALSSQGRGAREGAQEAE